MLNVLQLARRAAARVGLEPPETIINESITAIRLKDDLELVGQDLVRKNNAFGSGWTILTREYRFTTVAGRGDYPLPSDYNRIVNDTVWPVDVFYKALGNLSPQEWQFQRNSVAANIHLAPYYRFRAVNGAINFSLYPCLLYTSPSPRDS